MSDVFTKDERSKIMRCVKSEGNKSTEIKLIQIFSDMGIKGWNRHYKVKGRPDFAFIEKRIAVFVDGCFWHGHDCRNTRPSANAEYWKRKRERNIAHDKAINERFEKRGWRVIRIWECELRQKNRAKLYSKLAPLLNDSILNSE